MVAADSDLKGFPGQSIPNPKPCLSFWQRTTRAYPLLNANREATVPDTCEYIIIGSGIAGALTAYQLVESGVKGDDIVVLEAREAAGGASSRNAGHVRPDAFRGFTHYARLHGPEQARKIVANERVVLERVDEFVKKNNVQCDFNLTTTFDVCLSKEFAELEAASFEAYKNAGGDVSHVRFYSGDEAKEKTGISQAFAAYEWPAGSSHPAKLAQWLLSEIVAQGVGLFTHCPALSVENVAQPDDVVSSSNLWKVSTPRGSVTAPRVIHCTNAHLGFLLPRLAKHVLPNRAQAHALTPSPAFSAEKALTNTFSLRYGLTHFYSLIQRKGDGTMILGSSRSNPALGDEPTRPNVDDSFYSEKVMNDALRQFHEVFPEYSQDGNVHGEGFQHAWTGIVAMTPDHVPFVGEVPSLPGQYICAGFNAHGMARIFTCAPGVVKLILGGKWEETGLPECFQLTTERLKKFSDS
ncbi:FAD dependent oxidoreductase [Xylona heveae TC161]|uniref:FAD dependent oxidoreductase n=1 Tax=Xylona heveae (strain CBS 132557 / TC161) TaxID=1328760 RepID=A0A165H7F9_XYLHT|nr:FAD dependent oxidoreductase [Xylona heveae TC161]KZF23088.1 FAD dependent oxidoreductase [Xylona heveae TC161]